MRRAILAVTTVPMVLLAGCGSSGPPTSSQCAQQVRAWLAEGDGLAGGASIGQDFSEIISDVKAYLKSPASGDAARAESEIYMMPVANPLPGGFTAGLPSAPSCADATGSDVQNLTDDLQAVYADQEAEASASATASDMRTILNDFATLNTDFSENAGMQIPVH